MRCLLFDLLRCSGTESEISKLYAWSLQVSNYPHYLTLSTPSNRPPHLGGYDPRLEDNVNTLEDLVACAKSLSLTYNITSPKPLPPTVSALLTPHADPQVLILLSFTTAQRTALLTRPNTLALLYTPANEHFGIVPVEAMACGVPVLACDSGGPTESVVAAPEGERTGWLERPDAELWAERLVEIVRLSPAEREGISRNAKVRARTLFGLDAMARSLDDALREAVALGPVDVFGAGSTLLIMFLGFLIAYLVGPFIIPS
jgi:alpha-1,3/alpha-1,6-mannosyltransferase